MSIAEALQYIESVEHDLDTLSDAFIEDELNQEQIEEETTKVDWAKYDAAQDIVNGI